MVCQPFTGIETHDVSCEKQRPSVFYAFRRLEKSIWLVVLNHLEKYEINGKDDIPYMKWKIKFMFQTTNQVFLST